MKRVLLIFTCLVLPMMICIAQQYQPILSDGKEWHVVKHSVWTPFGMGEDVPYTITVCGDTLVDGRDCRKLCFESSQTKFYKAGYEERGKLYLFFDGVSDNVSTLLIDMNLHKGDVLDTEANIVNEDTICVNGVLRKRLTIGEDGGYWVEGIGSNNDYVWASLIERVTTYYWTFEQCYENGNLVFRKEDFSSAPITSVKSLTIGQQSGSDLYDVTGSKVLAPQRNHIYITNGKKMICK